jgi:hypothetical protein
VEFSQTQTNLTALISEVSVLCRSFRPSLKQRKKIFPCSLLQAAPPPPPSRWLDSWAVSNFLPLFDAFLGKWFVLLQRGSRNDFAAQDIHAST